MCSVWLLKEIINCLIAGVFVDRDCAVLKESIILTSVAVLPACEDEVHALLTALMLLDGPPSIFFLPPQCNLLEIVPILLWVSGSERRLLIILFPFFVSEGVSLAIDDSIQMADGLSGGTRIFQF
jgi:hypothetical protein